MVTVELLEIGGGNTPVSGAVNLDIESLPSVDIVADITDQWPIEDASVARVESHQVLEHISPADLPHVFAEVHRVLEPGGAFVADVPLAGSRSDKNDPTHRSQWYWRTPAYFTADDPLAYEVGINFVLCDRSIKLFLTSGKWFARPPSWLLKHASLRRPELIELVKLPYVTGVLEFVLRKPAP